jgi:hypothetical protein
MGIGHWVEGVAKVYTFKHQIPNTKYHNTQYPTPNTFARTRKNS